MTINLKPELERLIQKDIERGPYHLDDSAAIHDEIERAFGQFERGEEITPEESRVKLQKKKAEWLKQQKP
jgi:hypothetical protein